MKINKRNIISCIYIFLLLAVSGNPFFGIGSNTAQYIFAGFVVCLILIHLSFFKVSSKKALPYFRYIIFFSIIFLIQSINLNFVSVPGAIGFLLKITLGYIIIRYLGDQFRSYYLSTLYYVCLVSLFCYSLTLSGFDFPDLLNGSKEALKSIIIYTENTGDVGQGLRNSGMFWEPGAFAGYICLLFLLNIGEIRLLIYRNKLKTTIILLALVTTFSTTGYIVLFLIGIATILIEYSKKYRIVAVLFSVGFILGSYTLYLSTDFLSEKITKQFESSKTLSGEYSSTRFGAFAFDLHYIIKNPLSGNGMHEKTRYADHPWLQSEELGHGNGFSNFIATMGILGLLVFVGYLLKYNQRSRWLLLVGIFALLQGEQFLNFPVFLSLPFIFIYESYNSSTSYLS